MEFFFFEALRHASGLSEEEALAISRGIPVTHVYGSLGPLHYVRGDGGMPYAARQDRESLVLAANNIRVIPESRKEDAVFAEVRDSMAWAEHIMFLGFGFDELNVERLGMLPMLDDMKKRGVSAPGLFATVYDLRQAEINAAKAMVIGGRMWNAYPAQCLLALRESGILQM